MYAWLMSVARQLLGYLILTPLFLCALITVLLLTNLIISYWFQQRVRQTRKFTTTATTMKPTSPPVTVIPRLLFANELPKQLTTSLIASEYNVEGWQKPTLGLYEQPLAEKEVSLVLGLVVRDFVETWFGEVSADVAFPRCVYKQIVQALESIVERVRGVDLAECIVGVCLPLVTTHLGTIRDGNLDGVRWHSAISSIVGSEDSQSGDIQQKRAVMGHVRRVVDLIVPLVLSHDQASFAPHRVLVREILTGALLTPLVQSLSDPDTINQMVDGQLEKLIREQHMVSELRDVLDQQAKVEEQDQQQREQQREEDDSMVRTYDQFMAIIDECKNKEELERIRDDILAQIRKRRILIMGQNKDDIVHGQRVGDIIVYVNRLYVAKKKAERRLELLTKQVPQRQQQPPLLQQRQTQQCGGESSGGAVVSRRPGLMKNTASRVSTYYEHRDDPTKLGPPQFTLREILTNVSSLSAFAEYMDLIGSQFLLEFWINVEGVRQPRPEVFPNIVASLWKTYFTLRVDELAEAGDNVDLAITRVQRCLKPLRMSGSLDLDVNGLSFDLCTEALGLICLVQEAVFKYMETSVFPAFLRSAFYSRVLKEYYVTPRQDQLSEKLFLQQQQQQAGKPENLDQIVEEEDKDNNDSGKASEIQQTVAKPVTKSASVSGSASPRRPARRLSLVKSVTGSLGSKRSVSGGSLAQAVSSSNMGRKWNLSLRAKPEAPLVSTTTAIAEKTAQQTLAVPGMDRGRQSGRSIVQLTEVLNNEQSPRSEPRSLPKMDISSRPQTPAASTSVRSLPLEPGEHVEPVARSESMQASSSQGQQQQQQTFGQLDSGGEPLALGRRRSIRVGRSEVRRLSASLRSIALSSNGETGDDGGLQMMSPLEAALGPSSVATEYDSGTSEIASQSEAERDHQESEEEASADEAESLVLARVLTTPSPGDLFLDQRLRHLSRDIARKTHQMAIVRALMRQAQTRHRGNEQRVLQSSYRALRTEVREAQEQERLYVDALDDHRLTKARTRVHIPRAIMREEEDGDSHVTYLIEVQQSLPAQYVGGNGPSSCSSSSGRAPTTGWVVARRYREFFAMHRDLKALLPVEMRGTELPNRTPLIRLQKDRDIEHRRAGLERYVQGLLADPKVCAALPLKLFLSSAVPPQPSPMDQGRAAGGGGDRGGTADDEDDGRVAGWMARIHKTVGADIEGVTGADSMLELIVQELGAQVAMQHQQAQQHQLHVGSAAADSSQGAFVDPLSDLFVEVFGLKNRRNWLRRQAISILLRHIVGGAVERRIREVFDNFVGDQQLAQLLGNLRTSLWPANPSRPGAFLQFQGFKKRRDEEKMETARKARAQILWYVPRILAGMVGKKNARDGAQRLIDGVQMQLPNLNLVLHVFDALVGVVFPEIKFQLREE